MPAILRRGRGRRSHKDDVLKEPLKLNEMVAIAIKTAVTTKFGHALSAH
jgi:hypothetical protein